MFIQRCSGAVLHCAAFDSKTRTALCRVSFHENSSTTTTLRVISHDTWPEHGVSYFRTFEYREESRFGISCEFILVTNLSSFLSLSSSGTRRSRFFDILFGWIFRLEEKSWIVNFSIRFRARGQGREFKFWFGTFARLFDLFHEEENNGEKLWTLSNLPVPFEWISEEN